MQRLRGAGRIGRRRANRVASLRLPLRDRARPKNAWAAPGVGRGYPAWGV